LAYNLSYGLIGILYAGLLEMQKQGLDGTASGSLAVENLVFRESFFWFPLSLAAALAVLVVAVRVYRARQH
jgi:hypothetical protein